MFSLHLPLPRSEQPPREYAQRNSANTRTDANQRITACPRGFRVSRKGGRVGGTGDDVERYSGDREGGIDEAAQLATDAGLRVECAVGRSDEVGKVTDLVGGDVGEVGCSEGAGVFASPASGDVDLEGDGDDF